MSLVARLVVVLLLVIVASGSTARAANERVYVERSSPREVAVVTSPVIVEMLTAIGSTAMTLFERALSSSPPPDVAAQGGSPTEAPVAAAMVPTPLAANIAWAAAPGGLLAPSSPPLQRVAAIYLRSRFRVGGELPHLRVLELRARYEDGLIARVNGVEVVRRGIASSTDPRAYAQVRRGTEWETFFIPLRAGLLHAGENELVVEVRPLSRRRTPLVELELVGREIGRIVRGPLVQRVEATRASIVVETDLPTEAEVVYGTSPGKLDRLARTAPPRLPATRHVFALTGLRAAQEIHYQVVTSDERSPVASFHTAPAAGEPVRFVVYGDVRSGHQPHTEIVDQITSESPDFVLFTGDFVMRGSDEADWQRFFAIAGKLLARVPVYPVTGNHDVGTSGDRQRRFDDVFLPWPAPAGRPVGAQWYSFDVDGLHFVMLDSNRYDEPAQLAWLEADLSRARAAGMRSGFAVTHAGPWSRGPHGGNPVAQGLYAPLLERYGIAVIFSGHDHIYQRGRMGKLAYVVSGGGGAPLYPITCGVAGRPACEAPDGAEALASVFHYVVVEAYRDFARMCPKRVDGAPLEPCLTVAFGAGSGSGPAVPAPRRPTAPR